jgi:hypothetical protein
LQLLVDRLRLLLAAGGELAPQQLDGGLQSVEVPATCQKLLQLVLERSVSVLDLLVLSSELL